eukprot:gene4216-3009_t
MATPSLISTTVKPLSVLLSNVTRGGGGGGGGGGGSGGVACGREDVWTALACFTRMLPFLPFPGAKNQGPHQPT